MKKITILSCICMVSFTLAAQSIYVKTSAGYSFGVQPEFIYLGSSYYFENADTNYTTYGYDAVKFSLGKGMRYGFAVGTSLSKNIAFEMSIDFSKGKSPELTSHDNGVYHYFANYTVQFTDKYHFESKSTQIAPELIFKSSNNTCLPYFKLGVIVGITRLTQYHERSLYNSIPGYYPFENWTHVMEYKKSVSMGYSAAMGWNFKLADGIYFFSEAKYTSLRCSPKKSELTVYNYRGDDMLGTLQTNERSFEYVNAYTDSDNANPGNPGKRIIQQFALGNIAFSAGFRLDIVFKKRSAVGG
jgi:hypothetical protein